MCPKFCSLLSNLLLDDVLDVDVHHSEIGVLLSDRLQYNLLN